MLAYHMNPSRIQGLGKYPSRRSYILYFQQNKRIENLAERQIFRNFIGEKQTIRPSTSD